MDKRRCTLFFIIKIFVRVCKRLPEKYRLRCYALWNVIHTDTLKQIDFKTHQNLSLFTLSLNTFCYFRFFYLQSCFFAEKLGVNCNVKIVPQFFNEPTYIDAFSKHIQSYQPQNFDFVLFSYHALPLSQIEADGNSNKIEVNYISSCQKSTELLANALNLPKSKYGTAFQSHISKNWTKPFTEFVLKELARRKAESINCIPFICSGLFGNHFRVRRGI